MSTLWGSVKNRDKFGNGMRYLLYESDELMDKL